MKLLASIVLAGIFIGIVVGFKTQLDRSNELREFQNKTEEMVGKANVLKQKSLGAEKSQQITIPEDCKLKFENEKIIRIVEGSTHPHQTEVKVIDNTLTHGYYELTLRRTENGVKIIEG